MNKLSLYDLTFSQLTDWFLEKGEKRFRAVQVWDWLYNKRIKHIYDMRNLSKANMQLLEEQFTFGPLTQEVVQEASDGTVKYLFKLTDGQLIETVLMRQDYGLSLCVTTQVGCNIGCTFCASGILKKQRDLSVGEMVGQVMAVQQQLDEQGLDERISHVVIMGIGEPFDNYERVMNFIQIINHAKGLAIGARHITVSTSGLVPKIEKFAENDLQINLAISLHAPNDELRSSLMPINRRYPISVLMAAIDTYLAASNRRVTFEYILLAGINDQTSHAKELANLLKNKKKLAYVNLIPYNPVSEHDAYHRSSKAAVLAFYDVLKKNGVNCVIRREHGTDIDAACGQLRSKQLKKPQAG